MVVEEGAQPDIYVNGSLLNKVYFIIVKQLVFEANPVFSPRTHKCRVGAGGCRSRSHIVNSPSSKEQNTHQKNKRPQ